MQQGPRIFLVEPGLLSKLCCMLLGFLLFVMMLMLLVAGWVLPITFCVITAILTMINMIWVANLVIFSGVGAVVLLQIHAHCVGHGGPRGSKHSRQSRASHGGDSPPLRGHCGHLGHPSSTWYCWQGGWQITQHPLSLPTALEELWCGTSPARPQQCVHDGRRSGHIGILSSSVPSLWSPSV